MTDATAPASPLDAELAAAVERYRQRHPASAAQFDRAAEVMPGGNTRSVLCQSPFPLTMLRGEGCWLWDADGHRHLDALGEFTAGLYGHSAAPIRAAIVAALDSGISLSSHAAREVAAAQVQRHGSELAAILVEPMLGAGGCMPGTPEFLHGLQALARSCGALFVLDEVMTSRLAYGGRQSQLGLDPDLTTLGKYFGGGLSFGAFGGRREVMQRFDPRRPDALGHAGTFNNNVLTMAAGLAGLRELWTPTATEALNRRGERLREACNALARDRDLALQFTGPGSVMNLHASARELRRPADLAGSDVRVKDLLFFALLERGVFIARRGLVALSLPFGDAEVEQFVAAFGAALAEHAAVLPQAH
jgi:glutamate-1-semialdehyde aminotransferase